MRVPLTLFLYLRPPPPSPCSAAPPPPPSLFHNMNYYYQTTLRPPATVGSDPATVTYLYETPPGYVLLGLRGFALLWFIRAILITRVKYERKRGFYWKFALAGGLWIVSLPIQVAIAQSLALYRRTRFVFAFSASCNMLFFVLQFVLFSPSKFNRAFPFHAKTSDMEARPPRSTAQARLARRAPGMRAGSARPGVPPPASTQAGGGSVEMTPHGAMFRQDVVGGGGGGAQQMRRRPGGGSLMSRTSLSGGLAVGTPEDRVQASMLAIRQKIAQLTDHSDDLEYALEELDLHSWDDDNLKDEDYDLPGSRPESSASTAGGDERSRSAASAPPASSAPAAFGPAAAPGRGNSGKMPRPPPPE